MKFTTVIFSALAAQLVHCNCGDNCGRAIMGTASNLPIPLSSRLADCSSFMEITVIPAASTATVTVTSSVTGVGPVGKRDKALVARQLTITPNAFPTWAADACISAAKFVADCSSCAGMSYTTTTVPTPIFTTTVTVFQTVDVPPPSTSSTISTPSSTTSSTKSTATTTTTSTTSTTTLTTATPMPSNPGSLCNNPAVCAAASVNGCSNGAGATSSCSGSCYPDSTGQGRCRSDEFAVVCGSQPTCTTNNDCPGGFCITDCCGFPSCYTMAEDAFCENIISPAKMFKKREQRKIIRETF